jgi:hypothetical protein
MFHHILGGAEMPFVALSYVQGYRARSWVEYSLLKKWVFNYIHQGYLHADIFQILPLPSHQCRIHLPSREHLLAACAGSG